MAALYKGAPECRAAVSALTALRLAAAHTVRQRLICMAAKLRTVRMSNSAAGELTYIRLLRLPLI